MCLRIVLRLKCIELIENCVYDIIQTNQVEILIDITKFVETLRN